VTPTAATGWCEYMLDGPPPLFNAALLTVELRGEDGGSRLVKNSKANSRNQGLRYA
jgi:hypothetical protein